MSGKEPYDDADVPQVPRRDQPIPPPWVGPDYEPASPWIGRPVHARTMSRSRALIIGGLSVFLVVQAVGLSSAYVDSPPEALAPLALGAFYLAVIEIAGWWTVIHLIRHR
ncbi:hypothetical protein LGT39_01225 [Demequina sp. TTPB684]|uniref:hypothetical protein n=1 Tax=unclassified Demequina TaxID=2620311 RepID=UPI001CF4286A|nr:MULTISPECIES: hypothetical protein [unclassified Demequina]MCB2411468.1 hypothetical protein [Demequina sp. TTPB684]UPU87292.1 hypothetical protein LGT36_008380 [Demequina sp. TMPB413]